jgi:diguanylate cyclase (GGDEF)-like protein/putative nucleotidyltransferase with HDIG domain
MSRTKRFAELPSLSKAYICVVVVAGALAVTQALYGLVSQETGWRWLVLAVLTFLTGSATLKLPSLPATISVSETFVFTSVLLFGASAGTLTVALDAFVISCWSYRRGDPFYKIIFNLFALPLTIWVAAHVYLAIPGVEPLFNNPRVQISALLLPLALLAALYFLLNSWIITLAISLETRRRPYPLWREHFAILSLNYFGGASVAFLLVNYSRDIDFRYIALIVPLLVVLYLTFRWQIVRAVDANRHLVELNNLYMSTIETLAMAIDAKDQITHGHIRRVQTYAVGLAQKVGVTDTALIRAIEAAALLHDMGKLAVPEYILNKPGPLTPAEFEKMKLHSSVGADILSAIDFPYPVVPIVRHHHENWDGSGYPDGLSGSAIPIGARILSVVDCFDALTSDRPYRPRLADRDAIQILKDRRGSMYDPVIVDTFLKVHADIAPAKSEAVSPMSLGTISGVSRTALVSPVSLRPLDEITASTEEMLTLFDLARGLNTQMSVQDAGDVIAKHLRRLVPSSLLVFFVYDADTDELVASHASGEHANLVADLRIGVGQRLSGWVAAHKQIIRNSDPILDFGEAVRAMSPRPHSCLSVPLVARRSLIGVLSIYSTGHEAFSEDHQRIVEVVARQVSTILKNAVDFDRTKSKALRDQLTGLPNIEHLYQLTKSYVGHDVSGDTFSILVLDIDNLNEINESHGKSFGDQVLARLVRATRKSLRTADFLFRFRDDEFIVLLLQTDAETSANVARRISDTLHRESASAKPPFTVTIASATSPTDAQTIEELIDLASSRLHVRPFPPTRGLGADSVH